MSQTESPKIVVLGSINMDLVVRCTELPAAGETVLAETSMEFCGGKGANQAVAASLSGGDVSMIGAVGNDAFADRLRGNLQQHDINCQSILQRQDFPSGLAVISVDQHGQNSIMVVSGANGTIAPETVQSAASTIQQADVLLVQLEIPVDAVLAGIQIAKQAGVRVLLDPAPAMEQIPNDLFAVDLLCPNESEAAMLTDHAVQSIDDAVTAAKLLHQRGATNVAITLAERGTLLLSDGQSHLIPAFPIQPVDSTAAGDAFAGTLAVRWLQSGDLPSAVSFANAAGALTASKQGAQASMPTQNETDTLWRSR